ncbi:hypothetical protein OEZ85_001848 [Tetradesmus obliquus]|uniref:Uncharacterized protein n=1 Tax=Tetradesmus obliquus TaxID=3088 RepID=A0ABY8U1N9_TETOB|nr:hypothetical protein OEZ85_001848 [Tetradesmus obliquus]
MAIRLQQPIPGMRTRPGARSSLARHAAGVQHRRLSASRIVVPRAAAPEAPEVEADVVETFEVPTTEESTKPFPYPLPLDPNTKTLASIPLALFYPGVLALAAAAGMMGNTVGRGLPVSPDVRPIVGAVIGAAVAAGVVYAGVQAKQKRDGAAVIDLYNYIVELDDPTELQPDDVTAIGSRYGINMHKDQLEGLQKVYGQYLETIIPVADAQLTGDEANKVRVFKDVLGLSDDDAAPVHIEVGRRLSRIGFEYKDRQSQFEQRKAFQRLVYLSYIVFGEQKAAFLLPWRRVFNLTDAQLFVARRDNARAIFQGHLAARGGEFPAERQFLRELRDYQLAIKLFDESAEEIVREASRKQVEASLERAVEIARSPGKARDPAAVVETLSHVLDYARKMAKFANDDDLIPGLGMPSIHNGPWDVEARRRDVKEVFKVFAEEVVGREGRFNPQIEADLKELAVVLCLGAKEAGEVRSGIAGGLYKRLLREEVTSRRLDAAASPAQLLGELVEKSGYSPQAAAELHKQLYRTKLQQLVAKKKLSSEEQQELTRIRRILCITPEVASQVMRATAGRVLEEVVADIYLMGAKPVGEYESERVEACIKDLSLDRSVAMDVIKDVTKQRFKAYVQQAQKERDRRSAAQVLKKLVQFNALVVTPIVEKAKGTEAAKKELAEIMAEAAKKAKEQEEAEKAAAAKEAAAASSTEAPAADAAAAAAADSSKEAAEEQPKELQVKKDEDAVESVKKMIAAQRGEFGEEERKGQKEITLTDELEAGVKAELYKNYLMYSMSGDVVELPVGGVIRKKSSLVTRQAEMNRLQQLGDILGMTPLEVNAVHTDLAEQAYKSQATDVLRGSAAGLSAERKQYLEELRTQLNLSKETGDKILREARTEVLGAAAAFEGEERWTVDKVMALHKEGGVTVSKMLEEPQRRLMLRKEIDKKLNDGKADFDAQYLLKELPAVLDIDEKRVRMLLKELVGARKRMLLVQAVSQHRQRRPNDSVVSLSNLISVYRAVPEEAKEGGSVGVVQWGEREELKDLYAIFCDSVADQAKRDELSQLFGLSDEDKADIASRSDSHAAKIKQEQEEEAFFL